MTLDRRKNFARRRLHDAESYIVDRVERYLNSIELTQCAELPSRTHVALARGIRKRLLKLLASARRTE